MRGARFLWLALATAAGLALILVVGPRSTTHPFEHVEGLMPREQVRELLGRPAEVIRNVWVYYPNDGLYAEFRVAFGRRDRVAWQAYGGGEFSIVCADNPSDVGSSARIPPPCPRPLATVHSVPQVPTEGDVPVIDDSPVWKERLRRDDRALRRALARAERGIDVERSLIALEAFVFLAAYAIRKLIEAKKLSDEFEATLVNVTAYPRVNHDSVRIDWMSTDNFDRAYDFNTGSGCALRPRALCNLIVHSFVFAPVVGTDERTAVGFLVNSDKTKNKALYEVGLSDFRRLVLEVVDDDVVYLAVDRIKGSVIKSRIPRGAADSSPRL